MDVDAGLPNSIIADIAQSKDGSIWFATKQGISRFDGFRFTNYDTANSNLSGNEINALLVEENGLWVGTERDGLNYFCFENRKFRNFKTDLSSPDSLHNSGITDLSASAGNGVWIATYGSGVEYYCKETNTFKHYNSNTVEGMPDNPVWAVKEDRRGFLYIGFLREGLSVLSLKDNKIRNYRNFMNEIKGPIDNMVMNIYIDPLDNVWIATMEGLYLFNPNNGKFRLFRHDPNDSKSILTNRIYDFAFKDNSLWITCRMGGVSVLDLSQDIYNEGKKIEFYNIKSGNEKNKLSSYHTYKLLADSFGNMWICYEGDGVDCITHYSSDFKTITSKERGHMPVSLFANKGESIWIGNDAGSISILNNITEIGRAHV